MTSRNPQKFTDEELGDVFTVSEIATAIRQSLESEFPRVDVMGEIADFKAHSSGHLYMTLRDESSLLRVVVFNRNARRVDFGPENGMTAVATGRVSHYGGGGQTQLIATGLRPCGQGSIEIRVRRLLRRLMDEGLTDPARKRRLPPFPERIAVITSPTGAVIRDIRLTLARRWPYATVVHLDAAVQGPGAEQSIVEAFARLAEIDCVDAVILARGGGSAEDLRAFNTEAVARAVASCGCPVVTGIGHEVDTTVCDYVSDLRAATPTAAAELAAPDSGEVAARLDEIKRRLTKGAVTDAAHRLSAVELMMRSTVFLAVDRRFDRERIAVEDATGRLENWWVEFRSSALELPDDFPSRAGGAVDTWIGKEKVRLAVLSSRLAEAAVPGRVDHARDTLEGMNRAMRTAVKTALGSTRNRLEGIGRTLMGLGPCSVLERGYSYCTAGDGNALVGRVAGLARGDMLEVHFYDGRASCSVKETRKGERWRRRRTSKSR